MQHCPQPATPAALAQLIREAADLTAQWTARRDEIRTDMGLAPGQEPEDYRQLDEVKSEFESRAWEIAEALASLGDPTDGHQVPDPVAP